MTFFKQLRLLIWKNLSLRRRQMMRNILEVLCPLAIFNILVVVRYYKPAEYKSQVFFKPRALPSAGVLPFLQSFICDYNNPTTPYQYGLPDFSNTSFYKLTENLQPILQNKSNMEALSHIKDDYEALIKFWNNLQAFNDSQITTGAALNSILTNNRMIEDLIRQHTTLNDTYLDALLSSKINTSQILAPTWRSRVCGDPGLKALLVLPKSIDANYLQQQICKLSSAEQIQLGNSILSSMDWQALNSTFQVANGYDVYSRWRDSVTNEFQRVMRSVQVLQSLGPVLRCLEVGKSGVPFLGNMTLSNTTQQTFQLRNFLCGEPVRPKAVAPQATGSASRATSGSGDSSSSRSTSTTAEKGKCHNPAVGDRVQCGPPGISKGSCQAMGCCFNKVADKRKSCYCKPGNEKCCRAFNRLVNFIGPNNWRFTTMFTLILSGKIFYTPDTPQTRRVVNQANTFITKIESGVRSVGQLKGPLEVLLNFTKTHENNTDIFNQMETLENFSSLASILGGEVTNQTTMFSNQTETIMKELVRNRNQIQMAYDAISLLIDVLDCYNISDIFQPFPNEAALVKRATDQAPGQPLFLSSIVFLNFDAKDGSFPKKAEYKLRLNPDFTKSTKWIRAKYWKPGPSFKGYSGAWTKHYLNYGFVFLQDMVDRAIIEIITDKAIFEPGIYTQQFPYPCYIRDEFTNFTSLLFPLLMVLAWVFSSAMIIRSVVLEKELRLKEVMKVMGLGSAVHWTAWFILSLLFMVISVLLLTVLFKIGHVMTHSNPLVFGWMLTSFSIATIAMSFLISVFFSNANISAACGGIIYLFTSLPYFLAFWFEDHMTYSYKLLVNLFSTTGFGMACRYISRWEEQGVGIQWSNYYKSPLPDDDYSLGTCVNMMLLDAFIYLLLMWYLENIMPGEYGIPRKWYFPFTRSYWFGTDRKRSKYSEHNGTHSDVKEEEVEMSSIVREEADGSIESDCHLKVGVQIQDLVKIYRRGHKRAVDGLNLTLFEGEITSLLGHNGAGKSTIMSIMTGLLPPTRGTVVVYGQDIRTDIDDIRKGLGLCPQHNVLFDLLTVEEHMWFFAQLKGMPKNEIKAEIEKFLEDVGLAKKKSELSRNLSGGMKRKLSIALAFIANSKTVVLDEPTAGVDPCSRRFIWDLILKYKKGRTILLSTHYMDEADLLGDRTSIISRGQLRCSGAPLFLKRRYGEGYYLTVAKDTKQNSDYNEDKISSLVFSHVPGSYLKESTASELCYVLPSEARQLGSFKSLLQEMESNASDLSIRSYGLSDASLEKVFLKVTDSCEKYDSEPETDQAHRQFNSTFSADNDLFNKVYQDVKTGLALWTQQLIALLIKRFHHARRRKELFMSQILLPAFFVIAAMSFSLVRPPRGPLPPLKLTPSQYGEPNYVFIANVRKNFNFSKRIVQAAVKGPGLGTDCMEPASCSLVSNPYPLDSREIMWNFSATYEDFPSCSCSSGDQNCPAGAYGPQPPMRKLNTKDTLIDLTGRDISEYLLKSTDEFVRKRYGGFSIGDLAKYYPKVSYKDHYNRSGSNLNSGFSSTGVETNAKVWFNNKGYHALPTYVNVLNNAILRANLPPESDPCEYGIVTFNHPMDFNREQLSEETLMQGINDLFVSIFVIVALSFVPSSFLVYLVDDRSSKSKHLQLVSGLHPLVYWFGNYVWDLVCLDTSIGLYVICWKVLK